MHTESFFCDVFLKKQNAWLHDQNHNFSSFIILSEWQKSLSKVKNHVGITWPDKFFSLYLGIILQHHSQIKTVQQVAFCFVSNFVNVTLFQRLTFIILYIDL